MTTGFPGLPSVHLTDLKYTASRGFALVRKGSFRHPRTTSAHMLEYLRYDIPAMRQ